MAMFAKLYSSQQQRSMQADVWTLQASACAGVVSGDPAKSKTPTQCVLHQASAMQDAPAPNSQHPDVLACTHLLPFSSSPRVIRWLRTTVATWNTVLSPPNTQCCELHTQLIRKPAIHDRRGPRAGMDGSRSPVVPCEGRVGHEMGAGGALLTIPGAAH